MSRKEKEKPLFDKDRVLCIVKSLITHRNSILSLKYLHSHEKAVILYKDNVVELHVGDGRSIKYLDFTVPLSKKEYKELYALFMDEVKKRKEKLMTERFDKLERSLDDSTNNPWGDEPKHLPDDKPEQPQGNDDTLITE